MGKVEIMMGGRIMLKLTVKSGEYICIGEDIQVVFTGGSANHMHILVEAPKKYNIVRSKVLEKKKPVKSYYKDAGLSMEAKDEIKQIILREKKRQRQQKAI